MLITISYTGISANAYAMAALLAKSYIFYTTYIFYHDIRYFYAYYNLIINFSPHNFCNFSRACDRERERKGEFLLCILPASTLLLLLLPGRLLLAHWHALAGGRHTHTEKRRQMKKEVVKSNKSKAGSLSLLLLLVL